MARVAIDCDGVLADFVQGFVEVLHKLYPGHAQTEDNWNKWDGGLVTKAETRRVWNQIKATDNFWLTLPAIYHNVGDLARWLQSTKDQEVWIMTSRPNMDGMNASWQTEQWLRSCGVSAVHNYMGIITVPCAEDKVDICSRLDINWMVDDKVQTIESMDRFPYLHAALMDQPWNQEATPKWRVKRLAQFLQQVH